MRLHRIVVVNKPNEAGVTMLTAAEALFVVPHLHDGTNHSLGLAVGLRSVDAGKLLPDTVGLAVLHKFVALCSFVFLAIV